jgi:hypothetical protein
MLDITCCQRKIKNLPEGYKVCPLRCETVVNFTDVFQGNMEYYEIYIYNS